MANERSKIEPTRFTEIAGRVVLTSSLGDKVKQINAQTSQELHLVQKELNEAELKLAEWKAKVQELKKKKEALVQNQTRFGKWLEVDAIEEMFQAKEFDDFHRKTYLTKGQDLFDIDGEHGFPLPEDIQILVKDKWKGETKPQWHEFKVVKEKNLFNQKAQDGEGYVVKAENGEGEMEEVKMPTEEELAAMDAQAAKDEPPKKRTTRKKKAQKPETKKPEGEGGKDDVVK